MIGRLIFCLVGVGDIEMSVEEFLFFRSFNYMFFGGRIFRFVRRVEARRSS